MIINGREIAEHVYTELRERVSLLSWSPHFTILTCAPHFETQKYMALKQKKATDVGIHVTVSELREHATTEDFLSAIREVSPETDSIIVQLPLPPHVDVERLLKAVPPTHDADALGTSPHVFSPVVGACREILGRHGVSPHEKQVVVIGNGRLVGLPVSQWFMEQGAHVSVVTKDTKDISYYTRNADIIVCGAGVPGLLTPEMVKEGVVILDAGTTEDGGVLRGDADPDCVHKASLFTPVPGGIGPLTIAILLKNVVDLAEQR